MKKLLAICVILTAVVFNIAAATPTVSASKVAFKYCEASYSSIAIGVPSLPYEWNGHTITEAGVQVITIENHRGCDSIITLTVNYKEGAIPFGFTVASGKQVYFSKGNLQYCAAPKTGPTTHITRTSSASGIWRFAEHQWDFVGGADSYSETQSGTVYENGEKCDNLLHAGTYSGWQDLFRYGVADKPSGYAYGSGGISKTNSDWGYFNAISNGGNTPGMWYTLTDAQWSYLFDSRTNAGDKWSGGIVNDITGVILLPDAWVLPEGLSFTAASAPNVNVYTATEWAIMEENGAVFLPLAGYMISKAYSDYQTEAGVAGYTYAKLPANTNNAGYYWVSKNVSSTSGTYANYRNQTIRYLYNSATKPAESYVTDYNIQSKTYSSSSYNNDRCWCSVRVVCDVE